VLDLSYSMNSDNRLTQCRQSLLNILTEHAAPADRCGLVSFADDVRTEFPIQPRGVTQSPACQSMMHIVRNLQTRGMTAFYQAVDVGIQQLAGLNEPSTPKWLVALTDGEDNRSDPHAYQRALQMISAVPKLNIAIITVGTGIKTGIIKQFIAAAEANGNTAMLVQATNQADIAKAFEKVSEAMGGAGISEVL